jgi:hypothetical protein
MSLIELVFRRLSSLYVSKLVLIVFSLILPERATASCIVAYYTPAEIILAADSKQTYIILEGGGERTGTREHCKIIQINNVFFASSGLVEDRKTGYNATSLAIRAYQKETSLSKRVAFFEELIKSELSAALLRNQENNPDAFKKKFEKEDRVVAEFFFAGIEQGELKLFAIDFKLTPTNDGTIRIISEREECPGCGGEKMILVIGQKSSINQFLAEKENLANQDGIDLVRKIVQFQIDQNSDSVGPPIDILRIDKMGAKWIQKKSSCPGIKNYCRDEGIR